MGDPRPAIVTFAVQQEGKPYSWGATGPNSYDCSGLVWAAERAAGLNVARSTSINEVTKGTELSAAQAVPGDLVYINGSGYEDHSGIYIGGGRMIDAPTQGQNVGEHSVPSSARYFTPAGTVADVLNPNAGPTAQDWVTNPAGAMAQQVSSTFAGWQQGILAIGVKLAAGTVAGGLVVVGVWQAMKAHD